MFLTLIGASTFKFLNLIAPQEPGDLSYTQVVERQLTSHFKPKTLKISERFRFYKRNQLRGENVANYLAELRRLALTCEFGNFLIEALCDKLVCGLTDEAIQCRLLAEADLPLTKALTLAQIMETAKKDLKEIHPTGVESEPTHNLSSHKQPQAVCHGCLGTGHLPGVCRFKSAKCNKCHKIGHIATACLTGSGKQRAQSDQQHNKQKQQPGKSLPIK